MAANTIPIYSAAPRIDAAAVYNGATVGSTANTAQDGSGAAIYPCFIAGSNGSYVQKVKFRPVGAVAATVARLYICSVQGTFTAGTSNTVSTTFLVEEIALPAVTLSQTVQTPSWEVQLNYALPPGYRLLVSFGTSTGAAGVGYSVVTIGGDY